jgi:hypothetical protein
MPQIEGMEHSTVKTLILALATFALGGCASTPLELRADYAEAAEPQAAPVATSWQAQPAATEVRKLETVPHGSRVLGEYSIGADTGFFHNYESDWRDSYCGAQRPLVFATLVLFELFPTYWPCYKDSHYPIPKLEAAAKDLARKHGGNAVVVRFGGVEGDTAKEVSGYVVALGK